MDEPEKKEERDLAGRGLSPEEKKKRDQRNLVIALALGAFIVIVFLVTILRLGGNVAERSF